MTETSIPQSTKLFSKKIRGHEFPTLGFGTFELKDNECRQAVSKALQIGYRHIDTARMYENESAIGHGIKDAGMDREDFFITSKVWWEDLSPHTIRSEVEASLRELQVDYLDLVLIHWPNPEYPLEESIETLKILQKECKTRFYGVSNFTPALYHEAMGYGEIFCNQVEYHPMLDQSTLLEVARDHDSAIIAYAPLAQGEVIGYPELEEIGKRHGKSSEQVALRWLIEQENVLAIPRSSNPKHIESNFDIFDFELDAYDLDKIADLPKDQRQIDPDFAPDWDK